VENVAVVTAAGSGIGAGVAKELAERGYHLVLLSPSGSAQKLAKELGGVGMKGSITSERDIEALRDLALDTYGYVTAVFAGSGHARGSIDHTGRRLDLNEDGNLLDLTDDIWREAFEMYYLGVVRLARILTPVILKNENGGAIVNLSASAAQEPSFAYPTSSTIRRALSGFTKLYSDRYGKTGIRMNNLLPGYLDNWDWPAALTQNTPLNRAGSVREVAKVAAFLLSDDASFVTGQDILVDGGFVRKI